MGHQPGILHLRSIERPRAPLVSLSRRSARGPGQGREPVNGKGLSGDVTKTRSCDYPADSQPFPPRLGPASPARAAATRPRLGSTSHASAGWSGHAPLEVSRHHHRALRARLDRRRRWRRVVLPRRTFMGGGHQKHSRLDRHRHPLGRGARAPRRDRHLARRGIGSNHRDRVQPAVRRRVAGMGSRRGIGRGNIILGLILGLVFVLNAYSAIVLMFRWRRPATA